MQLPRLPTYMPSRCGYYLVRLLRPIVFFQQVLPAMSSADCELFATVGRDEDFALLLAEIARSEQLELRVHWNTEVESQDAVDPRRMPSANNSRWRALSGRVANWLDRYPGVCRRSVGTPYRPVWKSSPARSGLPRLGGAPDQRGLAV